MSITLDPTLKAAQDGDSHRPIVDLLTSPMQSVIPMDGNYINTDSTTEANGSLIITSTGRLANVYDRNGDLYYYHTDTDRTEWQTPILLWNTTGFLSIAICELTNNKLGIIYVKKSNHELGYMIIAQTGTIETDHTAIESGSTWIGAAHVITLANNTYLLIYSYSDDGVPPSTSNDYYLRKRTSSNFTSWGSASSITLTGLSTSHYKNNPHLLQITSGRIFLHFNYMNDINNEVELNNIYYVTSDDNGSTWTSATLVSDYTAFGESGTKPSAAEKDDGDITIIYQEENSVLHYNSDMDGWPGTQYFYGGHIQYDPSRKLLVGGTWGRGGADYADFECAYQINTANDTFITYWDQGTSPVMPDQYSMLGPRYACDTYPFYFFKKGNIITVINIETESIWQYIEEKDNPDTYNYEIGRPGHLGWNWWGNQHAVYRQVGSQRRLYVVANRTGWQSAPDAIVMGYFDLDQEKDPITEMYEWHEVCYHLDPDGIETDNGIGGFTWWPELGNFIVQVSNGLIFLDTDGNITKTFSHSLYAGFPAGGTIELVYMDKGTAGSIYMRFPYNSEFPDRRGIARLDLATEQVYYIEPNWYTCDDQQDSCGMLSLYDMGDNRILMACSAPGGCSAAGVAILDTADHSWTHYSSENIPGMITRGDDTPGCSDWDWTGDKINKSSVLSYDPTTKTIYASYHGNPYWMDDDPMGVIMFSEYGAYSILKYATISGVDSTPVYSSFADLTRNQFEYNGSIAIDGDGYAWFTWDHMDNDSENSLIWANTLSDKQVENYLVSNLSVEWEVDEPNKLTFTLSHGHLFDPLNYLSIWSVYFRKGRIITLKLGENVSDTDYLQDQGKFIVKETSLTYSDKYPAIKVVAEDIRSLWEDSHIVTTQYFSGVDPKTVTENLLVDHGGLTAQEYDIPVYSGSHNLYHQFVDMNLDEAIQLIMDHFGYYSAVNVDGKFKPRQIKFTGTPDHIYTDAKIIEFSPDSKYATWTNRIIVTGMSNLYSEVLYEVESIKSVSGTVGHWGGNQDLVVYYSENRQRRCRSPRLEITQSVSDFEIWGIKGGGSEEISATDEDELYLVITIEIPDLTGLIIATAAALLATGAACSFCDGFVSGWCGACIYAITIMLNLLVLLLGAIANYAYNVWARPVGHERATFQDQADDLEFQQQLGGKIVTETIDDPFCYTISRCRTVAEFEINVAKSQRRRLKFKKTGHLQDEIGDIVRFKHPYSNENIDLLVVKLKRLVKIGGEVTDTIEGWRLS